VQGAELRQPLEAKREANGLENFALPLGQKLGRPFCFEAAMIVKKRLPGRHSPLCEGGRRLHVLQLAPPTPSPRPLQQVTKVPAARPGSANHVVKIGALALGVVGQAQLDVE
jgi:hypothetical protein